MKFIILFSIHIYLEKKKEVNLENIFVGRTNKEIPESIKYLSEGMLVKPIIFLDISNNAINPFGA